MLELKQIVKDYQAGDTAVHALKGVSIRFRRHEFVAVLAKASTSADMTPNSGGI